MKKLLPFLFLVFIANAQEKPDLTIDAGSKIDNIKIHPITGVLIVNTDEGIDGVNIDSNQKIWSVKNADIKTSVMNVVNDPDLLNFQKNKETIDIIDNSLYFSCKIKGTDLIINSTNGEIVYDSSAAKYFVVINTFIPEKGKFLLIINEDKKYKALLYDYKTKKEEWKVELGTGKSKLFSLLGFTAFDNNKVQVIDNYIYAIITSKLYKLDYTTGKTYWSIDEKIRDIYFSRDKKNLIVTKKEGGLLSTKTKFNIVNTETGEPIWKDDIVTKYITYLEDWGDEILVAHYDGFNIYNYKTGKTKWKDDADGKMIKRVIAIDKDYLYVAKNEMMLIGPDGKNKWRKWIEISDDDDDQIVCLQKIGNNVLYLTATYGNMVDYQNGKKIWKGNIKFDKDRPLLYTIDYKKNVIIVYNDKDLYKFDPAIKDKPEPYAEVKCKSDKTMSGIELFDWGVSLTSQNEVIGINTDGTVKYQKVYRQPGEGLRKAFNVTRIVGSSYYNTTASLKTGMANATYEMKYRNEKGEQVTEKGYVFDEATRKEMLEDAKDDRNTAEMINQLGSSFSKRFNALKQTSNYAILFAREETDDTNILVKIRKKDGEVLSKIPVTGTKPIYEIDFATDNIYYVNGNNVQVFNKK